MDLTSLQNKISTITSTANPQNNYFELVQEIIRHRNHCQQDSSEFKQLSLQLKQVYDCIETEIKTSTNRPVTPVKFGTSGWRGIIGKDLTLHTVQIVTLAIIEMYEQLEQSQQLAPDLGIQSFAEARQKGVVIGHDNRFGGELFAKTACDTLTQAGFTVYFAGEATTGTLSAAVLRLKAAFSINLTPSHNPLEYAGFKFNASDGGPASAPITEQITKNSNALLATNKTHVFQGNPTLVHTCNTLTLWSDLVEDNKQIHTINPETILATIKQRDDFILAVDSVHGASRIHVKQLLSGLGTDQAVFFRDTADVTFGGISPEPSTKNLEMITAFLNDHPAPIKLGVILDPDGDRIRFTDGTTEINMNYFGAMAYHFLHEKHGLSGMVAKSVATSNLANKLASDFKEDVFEPRVGFKEFKPVVGTALVCFEESDGITITHHTPEKDGYIGLFLALAMVAETGLPLGDYYREIINQYGAFFPEKDSVTVSEKGPTLLDKLATLNKYTKGETLQVGTEEKEIVEAITIDGLKLVFADQSWLLIRPSGTEPKVRFYVESRTEAGKDELFATARQLLKDIGLL
jgi:phosphomannomutase